MPYQLSEDGLCVQKKDGTTVKCHKTHAEALAHMQALYANVEDAHKANTLKAIGKTDTELRVANYIVLWGGRDLTGVAYGKNADGSSGEYFTKSTDFESEYTKSGAIHVDFEHGRDPDGIGNTKDNVLGYVDWTTAKADDTGLYVERVLNRRKRYLKWLETLIEAGLVGNSTESVREGTKKAKDGEIVKWPLRRDTLTVTPLEPRMLTDNTLTAIRALSEEFPYLKSLLTADDTALTDPAGDNRKSTQSNSGDIEMTEDEVKAIVAQATADALAKRDAEDKAAALAKAEREAELKAAADAAYAKAVEDMKTIRPRTYNSHSTQPVDDDNDGVDAFKAWMSTGQENDGLVPDKAVNSIKAAWNVTTGGSGAFLVPDPLYRQIVAKRNIASWVRQLPVQIFSITEGDHILVPVESTSHTNFVLTAEAANYNEDEGTVAQVDLQLFKYTKLTKVSEEFLLAEGTNWDSWFTSAMARAVAGTENTIYTTGAGTTEPQGVVTGATVANTTATTDVILPAEFMAFLGYLGAGYNVRSEVGLLMSNVTKYYLLGYTGNPFLYQMTPPSGDALSEDRIQGIKVVVDDDVVDYVDASGKCIVFGNMGFYGVAERPGMSIQRNPYLYMLSGQVGIFCNIYRGGAVLQSEAFYYLTNHS